MNPHNNGVTTDGYKDIASIDCSDPLVAVIHMKRVYAPFLQQLFSPNGNAPILPEHLLAKYNDKKGSFNTAPYQAAPIGSGPFKFEPGIAGPGRAQGRLRRLFHGQAQAARSRVQDSPGREYARRDRSARRTKWTWRSHGRFNSGRSMHDIPGMIASNRSRLHVRPRRFQPASPCSPTSAMRRALAMATDRKTIRDKIAHGLGDLTDTALVAQDLLGLDQRTRALGRTIARARAMLDADGWKPRTDGIRVKNGQRPRLQLLGSRPRARTDKAIESPSNANGTTSGPSVSIKNYPTGAIFRQHGEGHAAGRPLRRGRLCLGRRGRPRRQRDLLRPQPRAARGRTRSSGTTRSRPRRWTTSLRPSTGSAARRTS